MRAVVHLLLLVVSGLLATGAHAADVRLSASSSSAWVGLPVTVTLQIVNASRHDAPLLPDVANADVEFRGQVNNSTQVSIINGRRSQRQTVAYAWDVTPRAPGPVTVPGFRVRIDGVEQEVAGLTLEARVPDVGDRVVVEVAADATEVYVGQPLELTLDIFVKGFTDPRFNVRLSSRNMWGLIDQAASRWGPFAATLNDRSQRGGQVQDDAVQRPDADGKPADYFRYRVRARVYPDRAGPLELDGDGVRIVGQYPVALGRTRDFFSGNQYTLAEAQPVAVAAPNPAVNVKPVPTAGRPDTYRGAVGRYRITAAADPLSVAVGDAVTLQMVVQGDGPLDRLSAPPLDAIRALTDDFDVTPGPIAGVVREGIKVFTTTIRPRNAEVTAIPPIPLVSFDPDTETFVTTQSEPITLAVRPAEKLSLDGLVETPDPATTTAAATTATPQPELADGPAWLPLPDQAPAGPAWRWFWPVLYAAVPVSVGLGRAAWWAAARLRGRERAVAARAAARARRALARASDADQVAAALRRYAADRTGRPAAAITAADAGDALQALGIDANQRAPFEAALRDAEAAACGARPAPAEALAQAGQAAVKAVAGALLVALLVVAPANAEPADPAATARAFAQAPPSTAALTNAATAWLEADEPARARAAALGAVRFDPASSAARAALADAEQALGLSPAATAGLDRATAHWLGWGGRRLLLAAGVLGLVGAMVWAWLGRTWLCRSGWMRGLRTWKIASGLALAAVGAGLAMHTALTVPDAGAAVLIDAEAVPRSGPGGGFSVAAPGDATPRAGALLRVIESRDGWVRAGAGWWPGDAVEIIYRAPGSDV